MNRKLAKMDILMANSFTIFTIVTIVLRFFSWSSLNGTARLGQASIPTEQVWCRDLGVTPWCDNWTILETQNSVSGHPKETWVLHANTYAIICIYVLIYNYVYFLMHVYICAYLYLNIYIYFILYIIIIITLYIYINWAHICTHI